MSIEPAVTYRLDDLAVFDEAHLREVIGDASGVVSPSIAGRAFASDESGEAREQPPCPDLAARIEHALPPDDRAAFARARQQSYSDDERVEARDELRGVARHHLVGQLEHETVRLEPGDAERLGHILTACFSWLPAENFGTVAAGMVTF